MTTNLELTEGQILDLVVRVCIENPQLIEEAREIAAERIKDSTSGKETGEQREARIKATIQTDFDRFEDVFKSLA